MPDGKKTVEESRESLFSTYIERWFTHKSTQSPMTAEDRSSEVSRSRSIKSAEEDRLTVAAVPTTMTTEDQSGFIKFLPIVLLFKTTREKMANVDFTPMTVMLLVALVLVVVYIFVISFYLLRDSFQKRYDVTQPPIQICKLVS